MYSKIDKETFEKVVKESFSIAQCMVKLGRKPSSGNYKTFYRYKDLYGVDTSHFTGQGYLKGKWAQNRKSVGYYKGKKGLTIKGKVLLQKLIDEGYKERKCEKCGNTEWQGMPIPLQVHHVDGNHLNNDVNNLQVLCPNCHALTDNFCGRNIGREKKKGTSTNRSAVRPTKEELEKLLIEYNFTRVGKIYGVSDNAVRKWCEGYGLARNIKYYKDKKFEKSF